MLYGNSELMGIINSFDEISWKNGDFWLREGKATHDLILITCRHKTHNLDYKSFSK